MNIKVLSAEHLDTIRRVLEDEGPIILEHYYFHEQRMLARLIFDDFNLFITYILSRARAGDAFHVWSFTAVCRSENKIASGRFPDEEDKMPEKGD